jgi:hypothetical protein
MTTDELTPEHFIPHTGKAFHVGESGHILTLVRVDQRRREAWEGGSDLREPFNLIFRGPPGNVLPEALYTVAVEDGPLFELYIIPVFTPARDRQDYQAAFN